MDEIWENPEIILKLDLEGTFHTDYTEKKAVRRLGRVKMRGNFGDD